MEERGKQYARNSKWFVDSVEVRINIQLPGSTSQTSRGKKNNRQEGVAERQAGSTGLVSRADKRIADLGAGILSVPSRRARCPTRASHLPHPSPRYG